MAETQGPVEKFCAVKDVQTSFENALGDYTPCFFDTVISSENSQRYRIQKMCSCLIDLFHLVGVFFLGLQLFKLRRGRGSRYRLLRSTRIYQWSVKSPRQNVARQRNL